MTKRLYIQSAYDAGAISGSVPRNHRSLPCQRRVHQRLAVHHLRLPVRGEIPEPRVYKLVQRLLDIGVQGITLCDTTGMDDPAQVERICREALSNWPEAVFTRTFTTPAAWDWPMHQQR